MSDPYVIAIDGPAASGKSSVAHALADELSIACLNTGNMYRATAYMLLQNNVDIHNVPAIQDVLQTLEFSYERNEKSGVYELLLNHQPCPKEIRRADVAAMASAIATLEPVRRHLTEAQRRIAQSVTLVMEGRDIGTEVFPHARFKFYLTASPRVRALRRLAQSGETAEDATVDSVAQAIAERDALDMTRAVAPLRQAPDAILIDSSELTREETLQKILNIVRNAL